MWLATNKGNSDYVECFMDCPERLMHIPNAIAKELREELNDLITFDGQYRYDGRFGFEGYWNTPLTIMDGRGHIRKEEVLEKIGFIPLWEMSPFEIFNWKILKQENISYIILFDKVPIICPNIGYKLGKFEKVVSKEEFIQFLLG